MHPSAMLPPAACDPQDFGGWFLQACAVLKGDGMGSPLDPTAV